jgi:pyruvate/2-oxoglutarate/acetoin dehydrogenase E1 component
MFGDFITLAFDQIVNNASKFYHMYNGKLSCPVVVRAPMGGRRGYGPTHSQSLERFLLGIDNCCLISPNSLIPLGLQLEGLKSLSCPAIVAENEIDYTLRDFVPDPAFAIDVGQRLVSDGADRARECPGQCDDRQLWRDGAICRRTPAADL